MGPEVVRQNDFRPFFATGAGSGRSDCIVFSSMKQTSTVFNFRMTSTMQSQQQILKQCPACGEPVRGKNRRLCWRCHEAHLHRCFPPAPNKCSASQIGLRSPTLRPEPTAAKPGTGEKVKVLEARAERGEELWHGGDAPLDLT